jgi:hypothetical protein
MPICPQPWLGAGFNRVNDEMDTARRGVERLCGPDRRSGVRLRDSNHAAGMMAA